MMKVCVVAERKQFERSAKDSQHFRKWVRMICQMLQYYIG